MGKLCGCGCGLPVNLADRTRPHKGYVKGEPMRFKAGHNGRKKFAEHGVREHNNGGGIIYKEVLVPDHHKSNNGYVGEHILIAEKVLGHILPEKAVVHHIDGNGLNNSHNNLVVCEDTGYHLLLHRRMRAYQACGHADWLKCRFCKEYDDPKNMKLIRSGAGGHHRTCDNEWHRRRRAQNRLQRQGR